MLQIAPNLALPLDAVTQTFGVLAMRGAGKTNLARVMAEEMFAARLPFVAVDPVGSWWGLRSSRDGKQAGLEVPIFGGRRGDVPLEKTGGVLVADLVVGERLSCVLDVSDFSEGDKTRFLIDFGERLYRKNEHALHLFLEEADDYVPQRPFREQARLLHVWENIVRRGRARGLGMTMITQRSAALNKNVLTQIGSLLVLRTTSPQDRKAIAGWVEYHGQSRAILESLPTLEDGEFWFYSPQWRKDCARYRARLSNTFDSGATPKGAAKRAATLADIDLAAVKVRMAETIERAKADDPRELKKRIAELEKRLAAAEKATRVERVEVPVLTAKHMSDVLGAISEASRVADRLDCLNEIKTHLEGISLALQREPANDHVIARRPAAVSPLHPQAEKPAPRSSPASGEKPLGKCERAILTVLATHTAGLEKVALAILAHYSHTSGGFDNALGALRSRGLIVGSAAHITITPAGQAAIGDVEPLPSGAELQRYWLGRLGRCERAILTVLLGAHPDAMSKHDLANQTGYSASSGGFDNALGRLRRFQLITGDARAMRASDVLFD